MPSLPNVSGREVVKAFGKDGWEFARQKGSHMIMVPDLQTPRMRYSPMVSTEQSKQEVTR